MEQNVTILDVARLAGVSKSTVSRYLNGGYVSVEKAEQVRRAIDETGFRSNFFARRLKTKTSQLIGIVLPRMDSVSVGRLLAGVGSVLDPAGYQGILLVSQLDPQKEIEHIESLCQQGVDGILVDSVAITDAHVALAQNARIPILFTGQSRAEVHCLKIDDAAAGYMMGTYLRQMGHRRAVFVGVTDADRAVGVERRQGFENGFCTERRSHVDFVETGFDFLSAYQSAGKACAFHPTVLVCATDGIALGVLRYLHECAIRVPEEISVVGFGGYDVGAVVYPALTTIAFDYERLGKEAAEGLLARIAHRAPAFAWDPFDTGRSMRFVERESVRALGTGGRHLRRLR